MFAFASFSVSVTKGNGEVRVRVFGDLACPKWPGADLAEKCTIVIGFDDRNIGGHESPRGADLEGVLGKQIWNVQICVCH